MTYKFGPFIFDRWNLVRDGARIELEPQQRQVLLILVERAESHPDDPVSKEELKEALWHGMALGDADQSLREVVRKLRKNLGNDPDRTPYIARNNYRLNAKVERIADATPGEVDFGNAETPHEATPLLNGADPHNSPYVGPQPFPPERAGDFFGRNAEVEDLMRLLSGARTRVVILYSPSGAGKTSLLNTALRTALLNNGHHVLPVARVGVPSIQPEPGQNPYTFAAVASMEQENGAARLGGAINWTNYLSSKRDAKPRTVLVIDQLEEIVTTNRSPLRQKQEFFVELQEALAHDPSLRLLLAFREEYLAQLQRLAGELSQWWKPYPLTLLRREDCEIAISRPAARQGVRFDPAVLFQLVSKLATVRYVDEGGTLCDDPGEFVEPLQLQLICDTLWRSLPTHRRVISWSDLQQASRQENHADDGARTEQTVSRFVDSVLHRFCEQAAQSASASARDKDGHRFPEEMINLGCLQFVSERGTRTPVRQGTDWTGDLPNAVADGLAFYQFLRIEQRHGDRWYELAHDTLIRPVIDRADKTDDDALRAIFSNVVRDIAATPRAQQEGITEAAIAQESCLVFVARDGTRLQASLASLESVAARLPLWVVDALAGRGILRRVRLHEQEGYELTYWRMALALHRERFLAMDRLYSARKRLATHLDLYRAPGATPADWYQNADSILKDVEEVIGFVNLSDMEARFALRASLASGHHLEDFTIQIGKKFPDVAAEVLQDASRYKFDSNVRRHAARALGRFPLDEREDLLVNLALNDPDESVQKAAASSQAGLENVDYLERLFALLDEPATRARALKALALIHDAASARVMSRFEELRKQLPLESRLRLRAKLISVRWRNARTRILLALLITLISTILVTAPPRALLATFGLTVTQLARMGLFEGAFQGVAGAIPWSLFIGGSLLWWWFVGERRRPWQGRSSAVVGALGGLVGGIVNTFSLLLVYGHNSLAMMQWIPTKESSQLEALTATGLALTMPLYGTLVGLGVGQAARRMLPRWRGSATRRKRASEHSEVQRMLASTAYETLIHSWLFLLPLLAAAVAFRAFLTGMPHQPVGYSQKLFGEALSLYFGGVGCLIGLFFGLHILRKGLHIPGDEELS